MQHKFFSLLRFAIDEGAAVPSGIVAEDWPCLLEMAERQSLVGVMFRGVSRLPAEMRPPREVVLRWYALSARIKGLNEVANENVAKFVARMKGDGFRCCVLKGQGNTLYYPDADMRTPGDIDAWLEGGTAAVIPYVRRMMPTAKTDYHHVDAPDFNGIRVEIHYRPSFQFNFVHNWRIQRWFEENAAEQFDNLVSLPGGHGPVAVPTVAFNRVFQMSHIANHVLHAGIGLKQMLDYYMLLKQGFTEDERREYVVLMKRFGMYEMSRAVMYVLCEVFGLEERLLIVEPHERCGRMLIKEIMIAGNFGHYDERISMADRRSKLRMNIVRLKRDWRMLWYFPSECVAEPFFRVYHFLWRLMKR